MVPSRFNCSLNERIAPLLLYSPCTFTLFGMRSWLIRV